VWKSIFMAGIAGVATVVEGLSRAFLDDGKLTTRKERLSKILLPQCKEECYIGFRRCRP
jgi:hypothetical protein